MEEEIRSAVEDNDPADAQETVVNGEAAANTAAAPDAGEQWAKERAELEDLLRRRQAEFENYRRRVDRERMEFAEYAGMESVRGLLPTLDDFERALKAAQASGSADNELVKGIELIYKRLLESLTKQGLEPIETEGKSFDPHLHEAVQRVEQEDAEDGAILDEYQRGYNFKGKLLRPAMVKVAVRP
ncbi:MAG TPA: nucleotide exchange factor GrpE [Bryobacteraceae bacterium]|nr:nucleotide exchange factor GrpE [Bryobacteraceae bacterium]